MRRISEDHKEIASGKKVDDEGYMARIELDNIKKSVEKLKKTIKSSDHQIPAWVQSKITRAADYIDSAAEYLSSDEELDENISFSIDKNRKPAPVGKNKLMKMSPEQRKQLPPQMVKKVIGNEPQLPSIKKEELSLTEKILSEMGCDCDMKGNKSVNQIAKKHNTSVEKIEKELKRGIKVEMEHTTDKYEAEKIALQHLEERPDYYVRLKKVEEGTLHHWFKGSKSKEGKPGWVQADGSPCANEEGETATPKCFSSDRLEELKSKGKKGKKIISSAVRRKRAKDPNQQEKSSGSKPTNVQTFAKGKKDKSYVEAEPALSEATKDIPGKGSGKKDACYNKVKSKYDVWPSAYACVPENSSKALTRDGWKSVYELNVGDEIMTYNIQKDELEFKPILNLHRYKNVKTNVVRSGNNGFIFEATDNHKWVVKLPEIKGKRLEKYQRINDKALIETSKLLTNKSNKHLVVSAQYNGGETIILDKFFKYGTNWIKYILDINSEQRQAWLFSAIVYDGNQQKIERLTENTNNINELDWLYTGPREKQSFGFKQKDIQHRDAFLLSAFLNSGLVTWKKYKDRDIYSCHYTSNKRFKNTSNFKLVKENISDVWCPETENGTWVMMQETDGNGIITITGNSGALVKCRKVGADNWGNKNEEFSLDEAVRIQSQSGQLMNIIINWRNRIIVTQLFFPQIRIPKRNEVLDAIEKVYPGAKLISFRVSNIDPKLPLVQVNEEGPSLSVSRGEKLSVEQGGGLTAKGRKKYNQATGSNLQAPVTGKVKRGSKAWKRRRNFCSRSRSWKGPRGLAARRRWKC